MQKILVVDDEPDTVELIKYHLKIAGYEPLEAYEGQEAIKKAIDVKPDLIILDLMIPGIDGYEVCKILRKNPITAPIPIIMCTARVEENDRVLGLELGADDYITKPFSVRELVLRVKNLLKRVYAEPQNYIKVGGLTIDAEKHLVEFEGKAIELTPIEFKLLLTLVRRRGRVQTREILLRDVWDYEPTLDTRTVDTHITRLRHKLGPAAYLIETVRAFGYRFKDI